MIYDGYDVNFAIYRLESLKLFLCVFVKINFDFLVYNPIDQSLKNFCGVCSLTFVEEFIAY